MHIEIRRGDFSKQILQGKMRSTANACNLTPRISIRGENCTHEQLRSRFTVQIMDARNKLKKEIIKLISPDFSIFDKHLVPDEVLYQVLP